MSDSGAIGGAYFVAIVGCILGVVALLFGLNVIEGPKKDKVGDNLDIKSNSIIKQLLKQMNAINVNISGKNLTNIENDIKELKRKVNSINFSGINSSTRNNISN